MNTPEGICLECGAKYFGWALNFPLRLLEYRRCVCGGDIKIKLEPSFISKPETDGQIGEGKNP